MGIVGSFSLSVAETSGQLTLEFEIGTEAAKSVKERPCITLGIGRWFRF